jgi:hypothetical protein
MRWLVSLGASCALFAATLGLAAAEGPQLTVTSPTSGAMLMGDTVTVSFRETGLKIVPTTVPISEMGKHPEVNKPGEGHVHFTLDLLPVVVWTTADPYTFTDVPPGEHLLTVELAENDHSSLSPPVVQQVRFSISPGGLPKAGQAQSPAPADGERPWLMLGAMVLLAGGLRLRRGWR